MVHALDLGPHNLIEEIRFKHFSATSESPTVISLSSSAPPPPSEGCISVGAVQKQTVPIDEQESLHWDGSRLPGLPWSQVGPWSTHPQQGLQGQDKWREDNGCLFVCISAGLLERVQTLTDRNWANINAVFRVGTYCRIFELFSLILMFVPPVTTELWHNCWKTSTRLFKVKSSHFWVFTPLNWKALPQHPLCIYGNL